MTKFSLKILNQEWLSMENTEYDLCSHGKFELIIGNEKIIDGKEDIDWTISTSILSLLRTIDSEHIAETDFDLIKHCGGILMIGCPIGIYLDLKHNENMVSIGNIKKQYGVGEKEFKFYPNLTVELPKKDYAIIVLNEAKRVKLFFETETQRKVDKFDILILEEFWNEFNELYENGMKKYYG
uniref:hypothetical protein n=1 Tax=Flavobacterium sp. TaxID=239 RepID=UPI004048F8F3